MYGWMFLVWRPKVEFQHTPAPAPAYYNLNHFPTIPTNKQRKQNIKISVWDLLENCPLIW